jgi:hypothetical protein
MEFSVNFFPTDESFLGARLIMGFWHTGYAEFHELAGLGGYVYTPPPPVRYACEHCSLSFSNLEAVRKHRFEAHPLRQPALFLRGKPVGALPEVLMTPVGPTDVHVEEATSCLLNGQPLSSMALGQQLAAMRCEFANVELRNQGAITRCQLDFRVADEVHLAGVEAAFMRLARDRLLNIQAVSQFNEDCRAYPSAMPYCDGIAQYLYGVMAKERSPESGLKHEDYIQRFLQSSEVLSGFDKPLARSVRALIAFHFNQFEDAEYLALEGPLRHVAGAFAGLLNGRSWHSDEVHFPALASAVEDLLTDQETLQILADASHGIDDLKIRANELLTHLRRAPAGGYNHMKRVLLACEASAAQDQPDLHSEARKLARAMAGKPDTSVWASHMLERLSST